MSEPELSADATRGLAALLDELVPPSDDGQLPGAGELGLGPTIYETAPDLRLVIEHGLAALDERGRGGGAEDFAGLPKDERSAVLAEVAGEQTALVPGLVFQTYIHYYQHPRVLAGLQLEPRPPFPKGYEMEPSDLSLLDPVRERPKLYRDC
jgi:hypothetical protein